MDQQSPHPTKKVLGFWARFFSSPTFWLAVIILGVGLPLGRNLLRPQVEAPPVYGVLPNVSLIDQDNDTFKISDFRGRVVLANFIFTRCPSTCPLLSAQMAKVQKRLAGSGQAVKLLSITVDPEFDTPAVLKEYAERFNAKRVLWSFATGPLADLEKVLVEGFKVAAEKPSAITNLMEFTHSENFVLVDQIGQVRGYRQLNNSTDINNVLRDIAILANTNPELAPRFSPGLSGVAR